MRIEALLVFLGLPKKQIYASATIRRGAGGASVPASRSRGNLTLSTFWSRNQASLPEFLTRARASYRQAMKRHHPDLGGSTEAAVRLAVAMARVDKLFARYL